MEPCSWPPVRGGFVSAHRPQQARDLFRLRGFALGRIQVGHLQPFLVGDEARSLANVEVEAGHQSLLAFRSKRRERKKVTPLELQVRFGTKPSARLPGRLFVRFHTATPFSLGACQTEGTPWP